MRGLRWTGGRRPARSLGEQLRPQSMAAMRRRFPIADCDHGEARWSRKMDECEGRISARELVARRCWASVRSSATPVIQDSTNLSEKDDGLGLANFRSRPEPAPRSHPKRTFSEPIDGPRHFQNPFPRALQSKLLFIMPGSNFSG